MQDELELLGLVKRFGDEIVIDGISFRVKDGEFLVLLGPSGGGKSTILRMICGLEQPDKGRIVFRRNDITEMAPRYRNVGVIFQDYGLYPNMNVYQNIAYGLEVRGVKRTEIERRVRSAAEMLEIMPLIQRSVVNLSGGEQQRVALARVLAKDADIYLYDEPLSSLDPQTRQQARRDILRIHRTKQKLSIYVTHDLMEAHMMADRIAIIANKRLQQVGTPEELIDSPANVFVARFVGTPPINLLHTELRRIENHIVAERDGLHINVPARWDLYFKRNRHEQVIVGLRPGAVVPTWIFSQMEGEPRATFSAEVLTVEPLFTETILTVQLPDGTPITSVYQETEHKLPRRGEILTLGIFGDLCFFDPITEQALKIWFD